MKSTRALPFVSVKVFDANDRLSVYLTQPQHIQSPNLIMREGMLLGTKIEDTWHEIKDGELSAVSDKNLIASLEAAPLCISRAPLNVMGEKNETKKAMLAFNAGIRLHECEAWGVRSDLIEQFESTYGVACIPMGLVNGFRPKSQKEIDRENEELVGPGSMTYGQWKGVQGPGALAKNIISAQRKPSTGSTPKM